MALLLSPLIGLGLGALVQRSAATALRGADVRWNRRLRAMQLPTVAALSFAHGANEAQKSMGIIALALVVGGTTDHFEVPFWVVLVGAATIPAGALVGGWRIVRTLGYGVYRLRPLHAAAAQVTAAAVVGATSAWGGPVSTSQVTSSAITRRRRGRAPASGALGDGKGHACRMAPDDAVHRPPGRRPRRSAAGGGGDRVRGGA